MTEEDLYLKRAKFWRCPGCNSADLIRGPRGGASQNVYCKGCGSAWNFHGVEYGIVAVDYEGKANPDLMMLYETKKVRR